MFRWVEPLRREVSELFYLYGRHCASHTTRTILLATLVVFVLTYPATNFLRQANLQPESTRFWESSMSVSPLAPELSNSEYLRDKPLLRIEQVIITATNSMLQHARDRDRDAGALTKDVLLYTHRLQGRLATTSVSLTASNSQSLPHLRHYTLSDICFKPFNDTRCLVHSPLDYWHNSTRLHDDPHILRTLNDQRLHVSPLGLRLHPATLYGHPRYDDTSRAIYGADSVILTYFLQDHGTVDRDTVMRIWNAVWEKIVDGGEIMGGFKGVNVQISRAEEASVKPRAIFRKGKGESKFAIFQHNYLPSPFPHSFLLFTFYISIFFFVSHYFGRVQLVKSKYGLGLTAVCLIFASVSCAIGVSALLDLRMRLVPWWVYPVVAAVAGLENMFILTNAVVCARVDGEVKEKVARGLRVVGAYITAVLFAEIAILVIGASASIPAVREFCLFTIIALCVDYGLQMTFFVTVLSVDVRRLELADLDNRRVATHLRRKHEDSDNEMEPDKSSHPVPVLEDEEEVDEDAVCVIYKDVKNHRVLNALTLCFVNLALAYFYRSAPPPIASVETFVHDIALFSDSSSTANSFWNTISPSHEDRYIEQMTPKFLTVLTDGDELNVESLLQSDRRHEQQPAIFLSRLASKVSESRASSRVRKIILPVVIWATTILNAIDLSILILVVILIGTVIWMMKPLRQSILAPIGNWMYITTSRKVFAFIDIVKRTFTRHNTQLEEQTFDEDKHHAGPNTYGRPAVKPHNAPEVQVVTLRGKHAADIQWLDVNPKAGTVISCGQDGRIVMWDGIKGEWLARLDRVMQTPCHCGCNGWRLMADVNMELMRNAFIVAKQKKAGLSMHDVALKGMSPSPARCVRSDLGNKWVACGFDDGVVRVWYVETGELVRELYIGTEAVVETKAEATAEVANHFTLRRRRQPVFYSPIRPVADSPKGTGIFQDRVTALAFVGAVIEYCHPLVAEAAAKSVQHGHTAMSKSSQNYLISAHKSGAIHEWDLEAGDCVNTLRSDQVGGIIALYVIEGKAAFRRKGVSWVFSSGKDGTIKCWERNMVSKDGREDIDFTLPLATPEKLPPQWKFVYTLDGHNGSSITSLSADVPVGGMGILITGSQDGAVKVWNFETGDAVCTLSAGGGGLRKKKAEAQMREQINRFNTTDDLHFSILQAHQSHRRDSIDSNATSSTSNEPASNHCGPITQIVVARYCRVETGPGKCRGCDTCFGSGFLVASSSTDETVRVWRLERSDGGAQGNCTLCSADYMHQHYRRRRPTAPVPSTNGGKSHQDSIKRQPSNEELSAELETKTTTLLRRKSPPTPSSSVMRRLPTPLPSTATPSIATASGMLPVEDLEDGMLDIEQLGGDDEITMSPKFLGRVDQPAGRGLVFCKNMMLAGVRRKVSADDVAAKKRDSKWEVWMASLKNYEAVRVVDEDEEDDGASRHMKIPVNTVSLDEDGVNPLEDEFNDGRTDEQGAARNSTKSEESSAIWLLRSLGIITPKPSPLSKSTTLRQLPRHTASKLNAANLAAVKKDIPNGAHHPTARGKDYIEDDEAANLLPFFAVRQIVPLGGDGFACDYGNFVKVVWIGNREADQNDGEERKVKLPSIMSTRAVGQAQSCCGGDGKGKGPEKAGGCCGGKDASTKDGCCGSRGGKKDGCGGDCKCEIPKSRAKKSSASAGCGGAGIE